MRGNFSTIKISIIMVLLTLVLLGHAMVSFIAKHISFKSMTIIVLNDHFIWILSFLAFDKRNRHRNTNYCQPKATFHPRCWGSNLAQYGKHGTRVARILTVGRIILTMFSFSNNNN